MVVYRVENQKREGPYSNDSKVTPRDWRDDIGNNDLDFRHPPPDMDGFRGLIPSRMRFGFESTESLSQWFSDTELEKLFGLGFRIVMYRTSFDEMIFMRSQVAFNYNNAEFVEVWL